MDPHVDLTGAELYRVEAEARRLRAEFFRHMVVSAGRAISRLFAGRGTGRIAGRTA